MCRRLCHAVVSELALDPVRVCGRRIAKQLVVFPNVETTELSDLLRSTVLRPEAIWLYSKSPPSSRLRIEHNTIRRRSP
jgi:hypothetical protein